MSAKHVFVDTNILIYAHDLDAGEKHKTALSLVKSLWDQPYPPAISTQILQELVATLSKKGVKKQKCKEVINIYEDWEVISHTSDLVRAALNIWDKFRISWWDSLVVAAAIKAGASLIWTEDLQHGQVFGPVKVFNPLI